MNKELLTFVNAAIKSRPFVAAHLIGRARWYAHALIGHRETEVKTYEGYFRQLWNRTQELYNGEIGENEFLDALANLIQEQITRAWRQALRDSELDPELVNSVYASDVEAVILNEFDFVDEFMRDIIAAAQSGASIDQFRARCELWANRYNDAYNMALLEIRATDEAQSGQKQNLVWGLGATEQHCDICSALDGVIAAASIWKEAGIFPQSGENGQLPNPALVSHGEGQEGCGGWRCDCKLSDTDESATIETAQELRQLIGW